MIRVMLILMLVLTTGCTYGQEWIKDPHYMEYRNDLDRLEHSYLAGEITYADYLTRKRELDNQYEKEVKEREEKIHN